MSCRAAIAVLTEREVIAFMRDDGHLESEYSVEVFVLAPEALGEETG
jgi:hypothetical protein